MRLTPGCPVITMRSPYLIPYEVLYVITMRCPYLIRYEVLYVIARHCPLWGPQKILCTFGEKAQTRKRVSVIVPDNVISKTQFAPHLPEGNHIIKPPQDTFVLAWRKRRSVRRAEWYPLFVFPCRANFYCYLHNCQYDTLAKYMTDCDIFFGII